ncbi:MAG: hypothetical protein EXX96DRAFT_594170 [Benjaminiella poitrasii]|nr:MAG: hypothetical protein EXX96DRAFT_594170 [Benjaminiella poitrasii]
MINRYWVCQKQEQYPQDLHPKWTISEYDVLIKISECTNKSSLDTTVNEIDLFSYKAELSFIKLEVMKLKLLEGEHNEDWYSVNFYRSECHSQTIKALRADGLVDVNEKDIRLEFIFTNSSGIQCVFILLLYEECTQYLCALSCHFNKPNLRIMDIPLSDNSGARIAEYLTAVISLVRMPATSKICYRENSPASKDSNITNTDSASSSVKLDWEEEEKS